MISEASRNENDRSRRLARFEVAVRLRDVAQRIGAARCYLHRAAGDAAAHYEPDRNDRAVDRTGSTSKLMETGPLSGSDRAPLGPARVGRRRLGARDTLGGVDMGRWAWLAPLGHEPVRLTPENTVVPPTSRRTNAICSRVLPR